MIHDLLVELIAQYNRVLTISRQAFLARITAVPDASLGHEVEPSAVKHRRLCTLCFGAEEDRGSKDPLEGGDKAAILCSTLLHPESVEHLGRTPERDGLPLLADGKCGQEKGNESILTVYYRRQLSARCTDVAGVLKVSLSVRFSASKAVFAVGLPPRLSSTPASTRATALNRGRRH